MYSFCCVVLFLFVVDVWQNHRSHTHTRTTHTLSNIGPRLLLSAPMHIYIGKQHCICVYVHLCLSFSENVTCVVTSMLWNRFVLRCCRKEILHSRDHLASLSAYTEWCFFASQWNAIMGRTHNALVCALLYCRSNCCCYCCVPNEPYEKEQFYISLSTRTHTNISWHSNRLSYRPMNQFRTEMILVFWLCK